MENQELFTNRIDLSELHHTVQQLKDEISKVIIGQKDVIELMIISILANGHVLLEGVPGIAKTLIAKLLAKTISVNFSRIQFTPDLMPSDILGTSIFNLNKSAFEFKKGPIFSNIVLIDEINRAPAKTQSALFEVMEERQISIDGFTNILKKPFLVFATQNPIDYEGTYRLPEAQLDRFIFKIVIGYPTIEEEEEILTKSHERKERLEIDEVSPIISSEQIIEFQDIIKRIHIDDNLKKYITQIVNKTRNHSAIYLGASPRASLNIMIAGKANAAIKSRDFVTPEDIQKVVIPVLCHRIQLTPEKEMEGGTPEDIIKNIVQSIEVPR